MQTGLILAVSVVVILLIIVLINFPYGAHNVERVMTKTSGGEMRSYRVHRKHSDKKKAAKVLSEIEMRNRKLMAHLRHKYLPETDFAFDGDKEGRIDIIQATPAATPEKEYLYERVRQLLKRYNEDNIYEISPLNSSGLTSYTENKGEKIVLCLREKRPSKSGGMNTDGEKHDPHKLHDINTLMFVALHEVAHIMTKEFGHPEEFWKNFRFILREAVECEIYVPVDYSINPITYCGLEIYHSPLF